jgi:ribonuclease HII
VNGAAAAPARVVAGVDEAGRGPLAGPVVVAACILDPAQPIDGLADSKALTPARRAALDAEIRARARCYRVVTIGVAEIAKRNILQATLLGMRRALAGLSVVPEIALIDGNALPKRLPVPAQAIVDGDALEPCISAASILAKVARDRMMVAFDRRYPGYGFAEHKGYSTPEHLDALTRLGPCPIHRVDFAPVRRLIEPDLFGTPDSGQV